MDEAIFEGALPAPMIPATQQPVDEMLSGNNMVANLPLLFAAGYPTTLAKITETQLEQFIPFMVQCSLGCIQIMHEFEYSEPEWWPENVPFVIPLRRPGGIAPVDWHKKLREIVVICYSFHKVVYLLRFCDDLATYRPESLRFINNQNTTTSLFERVTNKLLVTFRNENMLYDHKSEINAKKTLMPRHTATSRPQDVGRNGVGSAGDHDDISDYQIIDSAPFDIILCEFCDAELYSEQAYRHHERTCLMDDDVIFCGTETLSDSNGATAANANPTADHQQPTTSSSAWSPHESDVQPTASHGTELLAQQAHFLHHFGLANAAVPIDRPAAAFCTDAITKSPSKPTMQHGSGGKLRRWPRRGRTILGLAKCPTIPISSPAGQRMVRTAKSVVSTEYLCERLERVERFCQAPLLGQHNNQHNHHHNSRKSTIHTVFTHPYLVASSEAAAVASTTTLITYRRPAAGADCSTHRYTFPRRQFRRMTNDQRFRLLNVAEMRECKPMTVPLLKLTDEQLEQLRRLPHRTNFQMRRRRERKAMRRWLRCDRQERFKASAGVCRESADVDVPVIIDLCSDEDDDDDEVDENNCGVINGTSGTIATLRPPPPLRLVDNLRQPMSFVDSFAYTVDPPSPSLVSFENVDSGEPADDLLPCSNISDISITRNRRQERLQNHHQHPHQSAPVCTSPSSASSTSSVTSCDSLSVPPPVMPAIVRKRKTINDFANVSILMKCARIDRAPSVDDRLQQDQHQQRHRTPSTANGAQQQQYADPVAQQQESVSIYSRTTQTAMTLANHRQLMYDHGNQENQRYAANASANTTTTTSSTGSRSIISTSTTPAHQQPMQQHITNISGSAGLVPLVDSSPTCLMAFELPTSVTLTAAATANNSAAAKFLPLNNHPEIVIERIPSVLQQQQQHNQQQQQQQQPVSIDLTQT